MEQQVVKIRFGEYKQIINDDVVEAIAAPQNYEILFELTDL
jgi:hypothetical protein